MTDQLDTVPAELERLAQAFEARDFKFASVTLEKVLGHLHPVAPQPLTPQQELADAPASPTAYSQTGWDELRKTARAIAEENWSLAALCLGKSFDSARSRGITLEDPDAAAVAEQELLRALGNEDHSTAASCIRRLTASFKFVLD